MRSVRSPRGSGQRDVAALVLLDLSAAFDTAIYSILCHQLELSFGLRGPALVWFQSYLLYVPSTFAVGYSDHLPFSSSAVFRRAASWALSCSYTANLNALIEGHGFCPHVYADDMQVYGSCRPPAIHDLQRRLSACIDDMHNWMQANRLQLNTNTTELLIGVLSYYGTSSVSVTEICT